MSSAEGFPLAFESIRSFRGGGEGFYIVAAMFTPGYTEKAKRLAASCEKFGLAFVMHEVSSVHRSISARGTLAPSFTKANFIHHVLSRHGKPVLYVDADCEFVAEPKRLDPLVSAGYDFAIYNWLADEHTDAFAPVAISISGGPPIKNRFYAFTHCVEHYATDQLICSGPVQFYAHSDAAKMLLAEWHRNIVTFPGCADDACLDFTFNNLGPRASSLKTRWLPKAYARYPWWIYVKPVISHPESPAEETFNFIPIKDPAGRLRFYPEKTEKRNVVRLFPRDCVIDIEEQVVCLLVGNQLAIISPTDQNFWP